MFLFLFFLFFQQNSASKILEVKLPFQRHGVDDVRRQVIEEMDAMQCDHGEQAFLLPFLEMRSSVALTELRLFRILEITWHHVTGSLSIER
jgi:hypothetical protein